MAKIRWSVTAVDDLHSIESFIARDSILHAVNFVNQIIDAVERLQGTPFLGRVVPEFEREGLRELLFRGYRLVYVVRDDVVTIIRVVHGARDLQGLVQREPWDLGN